MMGTMSAGVCCTACTPLASGRRLRSTSLPLLQAAPGQRSGRSRRQFVTRAAASGLPSDDPYKVLGLHSGADSEAVQRQYNKMKREKKGNDAAISKIEAAHSALMMRNLTARMQGGEEVAKEIKYADKEQYLPWRPRYFVAPKRMLLFTSVGSALFLAWLLLTASGDSQALVGAFTVGAVLNVNKLFYVFPQKSSEGGKGLQHIVRGALLAFFGSFCGVFLLFTLPGLVARALNQQLPYWFYASGVKFQGTGFILGNFLATAFLR